MRKTTHKERLKQIVPNTKGLTKKQELFCQIYCTRDDLNQTQCAIEAGYPPSGAAVAASRFLNGRHFPNVVARIEEIKAELAKKYEVTFENHVRVMAELRDEARKAGQFAAAITAERNRGMVAGLYIDRKQILMGKIDQMSREEVMEEIKRLQRDYPELAPTDETLGGTVIEGELVSAEETRAAIVGPTEPQHEATGGLDQD